MTQLRISKEYLRMLILNGLYDVELGKITDEGSHISVTLHGPGVPDCNLVTVQTTKSIDVRLVPQ